MKEYLTVRTTPNQWADVGAALQKARLAGGAARAIGLFAPQIGPSVNTVFAILDAPDEATADRAVADIAAIADVAGITREPVEPASERDLSLLEESRAMFTNRWFHVRSDKAKAFEDDTIPQWDQFEVDTKCNVVGMWHTAPKDGITSYLLVAKYDDLAAWSASRFFNLPQGQELPLWAQAFARRRGYMTDTYVAATRCLGATA